MAQYKEKPNVTTEPTMDIIDDGTTAGHLHKELDVLHVTTQRPYKEINFIGTYVAAAIGALVAFGSFVMPATSLALINADIGPSPNVYWVAYAWTLALSVGFTLVGRLTDIFGRRWFFIGCSIMATVGCIVAGTASDINQIIGGHVLTGLAAAAQLSFNYTICELVPIKDRFYVLGGIYLCTIPFSSFGPVISRLLIVHTARGWRWDYYICIILNGVSTILYVLFYHPPNFNELHRHRSKMQELKDMDFGGIVLFVAGLLLLLMGLSWGGTLYPWHSAHVISTIVVGFVLCVAFVVYEIYVPLKRPLVPMHLFKNPGYSVLTVISGVGGMLYYSLNVIYPTMIATLFSADIVESGLLICVIGGGVASGQFSAALIAKPLGMFRWKLFFSVVACTAFTAAMAGPRSRAAISGLCFMSSYFIGLLESFVGSAISIVLTDQTEIGVAVGVYGSIRSLLGVLATSILTTILTSRVTHNITKDVVPALIKAGLPITSIEPLLTALNAGELAVAEEVPGVTLSIIEVAVTTIKEAYSNAFTLLWLVTLAFGGISCICAFFSPEIEKLYSSDVTRRLHGGHTDAVADNEKGSIEHVERV